MSSPLFITSIRHFGGHSVLSVSSGETYAMPRILLRSGGYRTGGLFRPDQHEAFMLEHAFPFAMQKAVSLLAAHSRSAYEISAILKRNAYPSPIIEQVIDKLQGLGYLNDVSFAKQWAKFRVSKGKGMQRIVSELRYKGIDPHSIQSAIESVDLQDIEESAIKVAQKAAKGKDIHQFSDRKKILAALVRRGYDFSCAKRALDYVCDEISSKKEEF